MILGYDISGIKQLDTVDIVGLLADFGYLSVAITLDRHVLNPYTDAHDFYSQLDAVQQSLAEHGMRSVVDTTAPFALDPLRPNEPTLMTGDSVERARRVGFLTDAVDVARELGSDCITLFSGSLDEPLSDDDAFARLLEGLNVIVEYADGEGVAVSVRPHRDTFIDSTERFDELLQRIQLPQLKLTIGISSADAWCESSVVAAITRWADRLVDVRVEDAQGVSRSSEWERAQHGFPAIFAALDQVAYQGAVHVQRDGYTEEASEAARQAFAELSPLVGG